MARKRKKLEPALLRRFTVQHGTTRVSDTGKIDTGANATNLSRVVACQLVPNMGPPNALGTTAGGEVVGNVIEVLLRVGRRTTPVRAFVPAVVYLPSGESSTIPGKNLIGLDFLRGTKSILDFRRRRGRELREASLDFDHVIRFRRLTKEEAAKVAHIRCSTPVRKSKRRR